MKKFRQILLYIIIAITIPISAFADMGPKYSVDVSFKNMSDELCYGTLIGIGESGMYNAPTTNAYSITHSKAGETVANKKDDIYSRRYRKVPDDLLTKEGYNVPDIFDKFMIYAEPDDCYFGSVFWRCSNTEGISWGYMPPKTFKVVLYFPKNNVFAATKVYKVSELKTHLSVDMSGIKLVESSTDKIEPTQEIQTKNQDEEKNKENPTPTYKSTDIPIEISHSNSIDAIGFIFRCVLTILIELLIAILFGYRKKYSILLIIITNIITQLLLNVGLFNIGGQHYYIIFAVFEIFVFLIEAIVYLLLLSKTTKIKYSRWKIIAYSFVANFASVIAGLILSSILPIMF